MYGEEIGNRADISLINSKFVRQVAKSNVYNRDGPLTYIQVN
jgi:hypothetical protein